MCVCVCVVKRGGLGKRGQVSISLPFASSTAVIFAPGCTRSSLHAQRVCMQRLPVKQKTAKTQALCGWHRDGDDNALLEPLPAHRAGLSQHFIAGAAEQEEVTNGFLQKRNPACLRPPAWT